MMACIGVMCINLTIALIWFDRGNLVTSMG